ncbi:MAG TPA: hypothetical protein VM915_14115 [Verrucomicrobiae bacterium]|nr:hypothetical protein [Verrucomicrobiae bacterium]
MRLKALAASIALVCMSGAAHAAPAANVEVCITDYRVQTSNARHSVSGFGRLRDGRLFAYSIAATDMAGIVGTSSSITPTVAGPGTGYVAGAEPELVRFVERAASDGAWLRVNLDASTGAVQKVSFVGRAYPGSGRCN